MQLFQLTLKKQGGFYLKDFFFHNLEISDSDFKRMVDFVQKEYGIDLSKKRQLIASRLAHSLRELGYQDFHSFLEHLLSQKDSSDIELLINKLTTNYTFFLREQEHFAFLRDVVLPELVRRHQRDRVLSIWSAGCSSGEEPYTISMYLKDFFGSDASNWDTRVLATDISQQALSKAREGVFKRPVDMSPEWVSRYFTPDKEPGLYAVKPLIKDNVIFRTYNLMEPIRFRLKFDVIFCRNVMIYFNSETRDALIKRFYDAMLPSAYLFISHSESLGQSPLFRMVAPAVYQKR